MSWTKENQIDKKNMDNEIKDFSLDLLIHNQSLGFPWYNERNWVQIIDPEGFCVWCIRYFFLLGVKAGNIFSKNSNLIYKWFKGM